MKPYEIKQINVNDYPACAAVFDGNCPFAETCLRQQKAGNREAYALFVNGEITAECHLVYDKELYRNKLCIYTQNGLFWARRRIEAGFVPAD